MLFNVENTPAGSTVCINKERRPPDMIFFFLKEVLNAALTQET